MDEQYDGGWVSGSCQDAPEPELTPEQERAAQRAVWKRAIAKANAIARNRRGKRAPAAVKSGMHRKPRL